MANACLQEAAAFDFIFFAIFVSRKITQIAVIGIRILYAMDMDTMVHTIWFINETRYNNER